jgi:uncharacterized protein YbjT (DUF2867 family)
VFVSGGTGYVGSRLIRALMARGHIVTALARPGSEKRVPAGCAVVTGDALTASTFAERIGSADAFVQLVGVAHPSPRKAAQFRQIDLPSALAGIDAASAARVRHFVYVSVAHPAPAMKAYIEARIEAEERLGRSGLPATILRPWYVLGPGHWWPVVLLPFYWLGELVPAWREASLRLGLVTIRQMVAALVEAIEDPPTERRIFDVPRIRRSRLLPP